MRISDLSSDVCSSDLRRCQVCSLQSRIAIMEASALHRGGFRFAIFGHEFVLLSLKWAHRYWKLDISVERTRCHVAYCSTHPKPGRNRAVRFAIKGTLPVTARLGGSSYRLTMSNIGRASCRERVCKYV